MRHCSTVEAEEEGLDLLDYRRDFREFGGGGFTYLGYLLGDVFQRCVDGTGEGVGGAGAEDVGLRG